MAWNVVIAGGGFGGATVAQTPRADAAEAVGAAAARERRQFPALYAVPARGRRRAARAAPRRDAASGDPASNVPPARRRHRARPGGADRRAANPRGRDRAAPLRPVRSRSRLGLPHRSGSRSGRACDRLQEPGRRDLASEPRGRDLEEANATEDAARGSGCSRTSSSAAAMPASRRWPSSRTSRRTRWSPIRAPGYTGCAGSSSRPPAASCRRSTRTRRLRRPGAPRAGHRGPARNDARERRCRQRHALDRRDGVHADGRLDAGFAPIPASGTSRCHSTSAAGCRSTIASPSTACRASGRWATARRSPTPTTATSPRRRAVRDPPGQGRRRQCRRGARRGRAPPATATRARPPS